jgi:hypothetical protein
MATIKAMLPESKKVLIETNLFKHIVHCTIHTVNQCGSWLNASLLLITTTTPAATAASSRLLSCCIKKVLRSGCCGITGDAVS